MILLLFACGPTETTFPAGLEPVEANTTEFPADEAEAIVLASREGDDGTWTQGAGYFHASLADVWATIQVPDICADRRHVTSYTVTEDTDAAYDVSFQIHNVVEDVITIEFTNDWRQGLVSGDVDDPEIVGVRWQKTEGSSLLALLEGSIVLTAVDDDVTSLEMVEHLDAVQTGPDDTEGFIQDFYDSARIVVHGGDMPVY
jgi:hypothetical protein